MNVKLTPQCGGVFWFRGVFFAVVVLLGVCFYFFLTNWD